MQACLTQLCFSEHYGWRSLSLLFLFLPMKVSSSSFISLRLLISNSYFTHPLWSLIELHIPSAVLDLENHVHTFNILYMMQSFYDWGIQMSDRNRALVTQNFVVIAWLCLDGKSSPPNSPRWVLVVLIICQLAYPSQILKLYRSFPLSLLVWDQRHWVHFGKLIHNLWLWTKKIP